MSITFKRQLGNAGELAVEKKLIQDGFTILARNFTIRGGEIDLIAKKGDLIAFIEVKTRKSDLFNLSEVITYSKQKKIIFTAKVFITKQSYVDKTFRFDVALVHGDTYNVTYIANAFSETE